MLLLGSAVLYPLGADGDCGLLSLHPTSPLGTIKTHSLFSVSLMSPSLFPVFQTLFLIASV